MQLMPATAQALAAGIAGLGGALYGGWQRQVGPTDFNVILSLIILLTLVLCILLVRPTGLMGVRGARFV